MKTKVSVIVPFKRPRTVSSSSNTPHKFFQTIIFGLPQCEQAALIWASSRMALTTIHISWTREYDHAKLWERIMLVAIHNAGRSDHTRFPYHRSTFRAQFFGYRVSVRHRTHPSVRLSGWKYVCEHCVCARASTAIHDHYYSQTNFKSL